MFKRDVRDALYLFNYFKEKQRLLEERRKEEAARREEQQKLMEGEKKNKRRGRITEVFHHRFRLTKRLSVKLLNIFLPISLNICFGCSKEPSHPFEYPQHMFLLRNRKNNFV